MAGAVGGLVVELGAQVHLAEMAGGLGPAVGDPGLGGVVAVEDEGVLGREEQGRHGAVERFG